MIYGTQHGPLWPTRPDALPTTRHRHSGNLKPAHKEQKQSTRAAVARPHETNSKHIDVAPIGGRFACGSQQLYNTLGGTMASSSGVASDKKHVCVIGGGVIGVTSAYFLAKQGYRVTVLEAQPPPVASVTSFANAGVVRATKTTALASPTSVLQVWPHCPYTCGVRQLTRLDVSLACRWRAPHGK